MWLRFHFWTSGPLRRFTVAALLSQFCQVGNFSIHVALRNLKLPGEVLLFGSSVTVKVQCLRGLSPHLRVKGQEDSIPDQKPLHLDILAGLMSKLHI